MKIDRDVVFLDLEATGTDSQRDRIVQIALVRLAPSGERERWSSLVNPRVPIPPESTAVHRITDAMVAKAPSFADIAPDVARRLLGADWGGFGAARFDIPMLEAEFRRAGVPFPAEGRRTVDAQVIFHKREPRNLTAALKFYCGRTLENAHDALADAEASLDVFLAQLEHYSAPGRDPLPGDMDGLDGFCAGGDPQAVEPGGRFVWRHGEAAFNFGKHRTRSLREVTAADRGYVEWAARTRDLGEAADICLRALQGVFPRKSRP
jgi:DNA polymerase-3 subunit epsilon